MYPLAFFTCYNIQTKWTWYKGSFLWIVEYMCNVSYLYTTNYDADKYVSCQLSCYKSVQN